MSDTFKRMILIALVVAASSAWYFLAPAVIGERTGHVMPAPGVNATGLLRDQLRHAPAAERLYGSVRGQDIILIRAAYRGDVAGPARHERCRSRSRSTTGSVAIEAIACP